MNISTLVQELEALGVQFSLGDDDQLRFKAPSGVFTEEHKQRVKAEKSEIVEILRARQPAPLRHDEAGRFEPFPLTDLQLAYVVGRSDSYELGGVGCHSYIELERPPTDPDALQRAWHQVVARHDMLRCTFLPGGQQQVLPEVKTPEIVTHELRGLDADEQEARLLAVRAQMSHRRYDPLVWPLFELRLSLMEERAVLHVSIDLLIADFASIGLLLVELGQLYRAPSTPLPKLPWTFRDVVLAREEVRRRAFVPGERRANDRDYWMARLPSLPGAPELPTQRSLESRNCPPRFARHHFELSVEAWQRLCARAAAKRITVSGVVLCAFTEVLRRWCRRPDFCINVTLLNRAENDALGAIVGDFIAVNVLAVDTPRVSDFARRAELLQQRLWEDMEHASFTGIEVLRALSQQRKAQVLIPVVYTSTLGVSDASLTDSHFMQESKLRFGITQTPQVWLDCQTTQRDRTLHLDWDVREGVFPAGLIEDAFGALGRLLEALADADDVWSSRSPVRLPESTLSVRKRVNETAVPFEPAFLHTGFCQQALQRPEGVAIRASLRDVTYGELARRALSIRDHLRRAGCAPGESVAVVLDKGPSQVEAILGILLSGCAYVPIDVGQPASRRDRMLANAAVRWVLTHDDEAVTWPSGVRILNAERSAQASKLSEAKLARELEAILRDLEATAASEDESPAYIIHTSGSTGHPKGVMVGHRAALNTVRDILHRFEVGPSDRLLGLASASFDLSVWDLFGALSTGATLVLPDAARRNDPAHWGALMAEHGVTLWNSVPAQMQMLVQWLEWQTDPPKLDALRVVMMSGDWIPVTLPDQVRARFPRARVISLGGPTETAIWCVWHPIGDVPEDAVSIPYGLPLSNHRIHVLNEHLEVCPDFVPGEMYIAGTGLGIGYAGDEAQTHARFIVHPETGERLYRSGDMGRSDRQGVLEILGRVDNQVKIRGHRIELGEIDAALLGLPGVDEAASVVFGDPLVLGAAVVLESPSVVLEEEVSARFRAALRGVLPEPMIPSVVRVCDRLPLSANGKVDRAVLKQSFVDRQLHGGVSKVKEAPHGSAEEAVADAWRAVLNVHDLSRDDAFFEVGGTSLSAVALVGGLLGAGYPATLEVVFAHPVLRDMAAALQAAGDEQSRWLDQIDLPALGWKALTPLADATPHRTGAEPAVILLTGASGFLGSYIVDTLLRETRSEIHCLVRGVDAEHAHRRWVSSMRERGLASDDPRVRVICGDVAKPDLGLSTSCYEELAQKVDTVIHCASIINLMDPLSKLYPTNVEGAAHVIAFASTSKVKPVNYVSTIAVHHALSDHDEDVPVPEETRIQGWRGLELTYEQSKIMAEGLFNIARKRGLPVNIIRPSTIAWSERSMPYINDDAFLKFYRACLEVGAYPRSPLKVNLVPVDYVARSVVAVARRGDGESRNYHVVARRSVGVDQLYAWIAELGARLVPLEYEDWKSRIQDRFVQAFVGLYFSDGMTAGGHREYSSEQMARVLSEGGEPTFELTQAYFRPLAQWSSGQRSRSEAEVG